MGAIASQITSIAIVYSTVYSDADQRKHQSSASLAFVWGIHRGPSNSPHKRPVTRKMFPFDDVIMCWKTGYWPEQLNLPNLPLKSYLSHMEWVGVSKVATSDAVYHQHCKYHYQWTLCLRYSFDRYPTENITYNYPRLMSYTTALFSHTYNINWINPS